MAKGKVVMAMSGGVDSSVAAALLVEQGYEVIGITMRLWTPDNVDELELVGGCCSLESVEDARRVADTLNIPFYVLNFQDRFQETVVDYFVQEYSRGRTPNPCIACNRYLKFDLLLDKAHHLGAEYVATGHYARRLYHPSLGRYILTTSKDDTKDQTYALYTLTQTQLRHTLFPLGDYLKEEVRELARKLNLITAEKAESQEICFIPNNNYKLFWQQYTGKEGIKGVIRTIGGEVLSTHDGIQNYTIGQRRGLGIAAPRPLYVVDIIPSENAVIVGEDKEAYAPALLASDLNWVSIPAPRQPLAAQAKIRYSAPPAPCTITPLGKEGVNVHFQQPQRAITPGQAVVFYRGDMLLGGGTIQQQIRD